MIACFGWREEEWGVTCFGNHGTRLLTGRRCVKVERDILQTERDSLHRKQLSHV